MGSDKLGLAETFALTWGNAIASAQWKHIFSPQLNSATTASFTQYQNKIEVNTGLDNIRIFSKLKDWALNQRFLWQASPKNLVKFGFNAIYHTAVECEHWRALNRFSSFWRRQLSSSRSSWKYS